MQQGNNDIWTYTFHIDTISKLNHEVAGTLRLSVPIANIDNQVFKVWFKFGKLDLRKGDISKPSSHGVRDDTQIRTASANVNPENNAQLVKNKANSQAVTKSLEPNSQININKEVPSKNTLAKYTVSPQTKSPTYADVALVKYPILQEVLVFLGLAVLIVTITLLLYKNILKKNKNE